MDPIAPGTQVEIRVARPATTHKICLAQIRRWVDGNAVNPDEVLKKRKLKAMLEDRA